MPSYSKNQKAAKDLLRFIHTKENYDQWFTTGQGFYTPGTHGLGNPRDVEARTRSWRPLRSRASMGQTPGYPGEPNAKAAEVLTKYLIGNMLASAIKGQKRRGRGRGVRRRTEEDLRLRRLGPACS